MARQYPTKEAAEENGIYNQLNLFGDNPNFIEIVSDTASELAKECYQ